MSELLQAAKDVIEAEFVSQKKVAIENLRAAVERAASAPKPGLEQLLDRIRFLEQQIAEKNK